MNKDMCKANSMRPKCARHEAFHAQQAHMQCRKRLYVKIGCWKVEQATALFLQDCRVDQAQAQTAAVLRGLRVVVYDLVVVLVESCRQVSLSCCNTDSIGDSLTQRTCV